jgi:hypothetical protein
MKLLGPSGPIPIQKKKKHLFAKTTSKSNIDLQIEALIISKILWSWLVVKQWRGLIRE